MQMVVLRFREKGFAATVRASVRHVLRAVLTRLEVKDYGENANLQVLRSDFALNAQAAARRGDWHNAGLFWQKELGSPAQPYIGLSEAAAAQGDMARADAILRDSLTQLPDNALLLEAYCQLALKTKRWGEVTRRWQMIEDSGCLIDPKLKPPIVEAFLQIGDLDRAAALVADMRPALAETSSFLRVDALLAEAREEWMIAADLWLQRGKLAKGVAQVASYERSVRALIRANDLDRAEEQTQTLVRKFPKTIKYAKLHAEVAIAQDAWAVALERWQAVEALDPAEAGAMPSAWIFQIGVDAASKRTEAIRIARLRATGMLALASTIQTIEEASALVLARRARKYYPDKVKAMVATVLAANARHSAAIWWQRRLMASSRNPKIYYPQIIESMLESSRLDDCAAVLAEYEAAYGRDNLWLRGMVETRYRQGDLVGMRDVMQAAVTTKLKVNFKSVKVMLWLLTIIRMHPHPHTFLPEEIHDLVLRTAALYDSQFLANSIAMLLDPARGDSAVGGYVSQIEAARNGDVEIDYVEREEMLQFLMQRRDWNQVQALLDLPLPEDLTHHNAKKAWKIFSMKIDLLLGQADRSGAETAALAFVKQLGSLGLDGYAMQITPSILFRLPFSVSVIDVLLAIAEKIRYTLMVERLSTWKNRYGSFETKKIINIAKRKRCFVIGNAPSLANLPLHYLENEDIFCVNRGMRATALSLPNPKYLVIGDPLVFKSHKLELLNDAMLVDEIFIGSNCLWRLNPEIPLIPYGTSGLKLSLSPFSPAPLHFHRGETVVALATQIAYCMGYEDIYVIGVDLDYSGPNTHFFGGGQKEKERLQGHRPGGAGADITNYAFRNMNIVFEGSGCRIYNAGRGGKLDSIPRVTFEDLFDHKEIA
ncbi:6-hydroxymethylpterin diphosphokinase MptE-like protein [Roseinatronobacter thiooxidans]|nr:6-hydroxymethylpterin diphosphokinase MptE-like protein [Roseinatronobacter thiooxidans]